MVVGHLVQSGPPNKQDLFTDPWAEHQIQLFSYIPAKQIMYVSQKSFVFVGIHLNLLWTWSETTMRLLET